MEKSCLTAGFRCLPYVTEPEGNPLGPAVSSKLPSQSSTREPRGAGTFRMFSDIPEHRIDCPPRQRHLAPGTGHLERPSQIRPAYASAYGGPATSALAATSTTYVPALVTPCRWFNVGGLLAHNISKSVPLTPALAVAPSRPLCPSRLPSPSSVSRVYYK